MKKLTILILALALAGCMGVDTIRVNSVPTQAKLYVNGEYAGLTPCSVPADWYKVFGIFRGDNVNLTLEKEGYKTLQKSVPASERKARRQKGDYINASDFGSGYLSSGLTFVYTINLEPQPAR